MVGVLSPLASSSQNGMLFFTCFCNQSIIHVIFSWMPCRHQLVPFWRLSTSLILVLVLTAYCLICETVQNYRVLWTGVGAQLARDVPFSAICWSTLEPVSFCSLGHGGSYLLNFMPHFHDMNLTC